MPVKVFTRAEQVSWPTAPSCPSWSTIEPLVLACLVMDVRDERDERDEIERCLEPDPYVDCDHAAVVRYATERGGSDENGARAIAVRLYYAIRDGFRYSPWNVELSHEGFRASNFLIGRGARGAGHCIDKATLLAACARSRGIPARLHFANVRNHIGTEELEQVLGTDLLVFHGYTELHLEGRWVAATPAFNKELCEHLGVAPLEFNGREDSVFQQYDKDGGRFMEYVHDYGAFPTIPYELMVGEWRKHYRVFREANVWPSRNNTENRGSNPPATSS